MLYLHAGLAPPIHYLDWPRWYLRAGFATCMYAPYPSHRGAVGVSYTLYTIYLQTTYSISAHTDSTCTACVCLCIFIYIYACTSYYQDLVCYTYVLAMYYLYIICMIPIYPTHPTGEQRTTYTHLYSLYMCIHYHYVHDVQDSFPKPRHPAGLAMCDLFTWSHMLCLRASKVLLPTHYVQDTSMIVQLYAPHLLHRGGVEVS